MMMASMSAIGASAADITFNMTTVNNVNYQKTINVYNKSYIAKINNSQKVPSQNANFILKASKSNNYVSVSKTTNTGKLKFVTQIEKYDKKTKKTTSQAYSNIITTNAGCGVGYKRDSANKNYKYILSLSVSNPSSTADPFSSKNLRVEAKQY